MVEKPGVRKLSIGLGLNREGPIVDPDYGDILIFTEEHSPASKPNTCSVVTMEKPGWKKNNF